MTRRRSDRGSATVWVLACCVLLLTVAGVTIVRTAAVLARHRAESAADLAALAAAGRIGVADDSCAMATRTALGNGASVRSCRVVQAADGRSGSVRVVVVIRVRLPVVGEQTVTASARAGRLRSGSCTASNTGVTAASSRTRASLRYEVPDPAVAC